MGALGPYRILSLLGKGGMGAVYQAVDSRLGRHVALKVMLPAFAANEAARERFLREARTTARIAHDHVVTVYEADVHGGIPYIVMPLLKGCTVDKSLQTGIPPVSEVLRIGREAALGLDAAHQVGLVHRDVKPANLWLEENTGRVKVLDFGLAKPVDEEVELTRNGAIVGTPAFMSPEQARGEKVDHRTDLFSLGAVLYRLGAGKLPFDGPSAMAVLMALGTMEPKPIRECNPVVPASLAELIRQLLAKDPSGRPASAGEVAKRLREIEAEEGLATRDSALAHHHPAPPAPTGTTTAGKMLEGGKRARFRWWALVAAAGAVAALAFGLRAGLHWLGDGKSKADPDPLVEMRRKEIEREVAILLSQPTVPVTQQAPDYSEVDAFEPIDYSAFQFLTDERVIDLRLWRDVPSDRLHEPYEAVVFNRRLRLRKIKAATEFVSESRTGGLDVYCRCSSPYPYRAAGLKRPVFVGQDRMKARRLIVDVGRVPVGEEFELRLNMTYWNSLQTEREQWFGLIGYEGAFKASQLLLFPPGKPFQQIRLMTAKTTKDQSISYDGPRIVLSGDGHDWVYWEVPNPEAGRVYKIHWDW